MCTQCIAHSWHLGDIFRSTGYRRYAVKIGANSEVVDSRNINGVNDAGCDHRASDLRQPLHVYE